jgi:O-antigen/teichoic acid export membrane protein
MVRGLLTQLSRESFVYVLSAGASKLIGFVLVPLYTHLLSPADFGTLNLLTTGTAILSSLLILGLDTAAALNYYATDDPTERRVVASTFLYFELVVASLVCIVLFLLAYPLAVFVFNDPAFTGYVQLGVAGVPFAVFVMLFLDVSRLARLPWRYLIIAVCNLLLTAVLIVTAVAGLRLGISGVLGATLIGSAVFSIAGGWMTRAQYTRILSVALLKRMLRTGLPLVPVTIAYWVINFSSLWFLYHLAAQPLDQVALLALATRLCAPVVLVVTAFQIAWVPFSLSIARHEAAGPVYARTLLYFLAGTLGVLLLLTVCAAPLIELFATPAYLPAVQVLALVGMSSIAYGAYYIVATGINLSGRTMHIGWTTVVAALLNIVLNVLLIPSLGFVGAALAGLVANVMAVGLIYSQAQRLYRLPYDLPRAGLLAAAGALCLAAATLLHGSGLALDVALRIALVLAFAGALVLLGVVRMRDLQMLRRMIAGATRRGAGA